MIIVFRGFTAGVYVTVHEPDEDKLQEEELKEPAAFPSLQDTELVGGVGELEVSTTVTVNVTDPPEGTIA